MKSFLTQLTKLSLALAALSFMQACSEPSNYSEHKVAIAYDSSGTVSVRPYTRSIFSSENF